MVMVEVTAMIPMVLVGVGMGSSVEEMVGVRRYVLVPTRAVIVVTRVMVGARLWLLQRLY